MRLKFFEAVGAPLLGADAIVHDEQPIRVVLLLNPGKARIIGPPVGSLEVFLEVIAFADIGSVIPSDRPQLIPELIDPSRSFPAFGNRRLMTGNSGVTGFLAIGDD